MTVEVLPIRLQDVFARVQDSRIFNQQSYKYESEESEAAAVKSVNMDLGGSKLFLSGDKMFGYIWRNPNLKNQIINIVIPGLRNRYFQDKHLLSHEEQAILNTSMNQQLPVFYNIYDYSSLKGFSEKANVNEYQLMGTITPYDVLHISVVNFVDLINRKQPLRFKLEPLPLIISIEYYDYNFWDNQYQKIINHIDL